jgi:hypothetical protein
MKQIFLLVILFIANNSFSQADKKVSVFLSFQANTTLYDRTASNNSAGVGFGLQTVLNTKTLIRPTLEINGDLFAGTKVLYTTADDKPIYGKSEVMSIHAGSFIQLSGQFFMAATFGSHFYNDDAHFSIRPSIGVYSTKGRRWTLKSSFTNVFQRDEIGKENFGYVSFAIALKL